DAAEAFRLAIEKSATGAVYNVVGDTGIEVKKIAELIGEKLGLPLVSLSEEQIVKHFEWMSGFIAFDSPAIHLKTQEQLGWKSEHLGLLDDMRQNYLKFYDGTASAYKRETNQPISPASWSAEARTSADQHRRLFFRKAPDWNRSELDFRFLSNRD